jgi:hypothetical protein
MPDVRQTELDARIVRRILADMDEEWPWPEYPGLRREDIALCLTTGTLGPLIGGDGILAKAFTDSLETCVPEVDGGDWQYLQEFVHERDGAYTDDELRRGIERVLVIARAAQTN